MADELWVVDSRGNSKRNHNVIQRFIRRMAIRCTSAAKFVEEVGLRCGYVLALFGMYLEGPEEDRSERPRLSECVIFLGIIADSVAEKMAPPA